MPRKFTFTTQVYDEKTDFPTTGDVDVIYIDASTNIAYRYDESYYQISSTEVNIWGALGSVSKGGGGGGGGATWGSITGTLSSQTDLQTALDAKQDDLILTTTGTSGAATLVGSTLNIPQYGASGLKGVHAIVPPTSGDQVLPILTGATAAQTNTANRLILYPFIPSNTIVISNLMINTTTSVAGALARLLIYSDLNGRPNTKLFESTNIDCSFAGIKTFLLSYTFNAGTTYWLGFHVGATSASFVSLNPNNTYTFRGNFTAGVNSYYLTATLGSAPSVISTIIAQTSQLPAIALTIA